MPNLVCYKYWFSRNGKDRSQKSVINQFNTENFSDKLVGGAKVMSSVLMTNQRAPH